VGGTRSCAGVIAASACVDVVGLRLVERCWAGGRLEPMPAGLEEIGNVLVPRELRCPADDWGPSPVVCGRTQSPNGKYVLDAGACGRRTV